MDVECKYCGKPVRWFLTPAGVPLPFNLAMVDIAKAGGTGWVPLNGPAGTYLRPTRDLSEFKLEKVKWVAIKHQCAEYEIAKMRISVLDWADEWTKKLLVGLQQRWPKVVACPQCRHRVADHRTGGCVGGRGPRRCGCARTSTDLARQRRQSQGGLAFRAISLFMNKVLMLQLDV